MDGRLLCKVIQRVEVVAGIEAFLILTVAAFCLAVVAWGVGADELMTKAQFGSGSFKQRRQVAPAVGKRLVNSKPLSVCTDSTLILRRAYHAVSLRRKSAEEQADCFG